MSNLRFSVYEHSLIIQDTQIITRKFIVLKDPNQMIVAWTDYHKYIRAGKHKYAKRVSDNGNKRIYYICKFLNYVFFEQYHISRLTDVTIPMVQDYLNAYGLGTLSENDKKRSASTVETCVRFIIDFLEEVSSHYTTCRFKTSELYKTVKVQNKHGKIVSKNVPIFEVNYAEKHHAIFRDMPEKVFSIFLNVVAKKHTNLLMLVALSAFAGLRPSEACNVRRTDSQIGPGIQFTIIDGTVQDIAIDLRYEHNLRSDLKPVGGIKKERMQRVHPAFRNAFCECYNIYMDYIEGKKYETAYGALTTNKQGKAITYFNYYQCFKKIIQDVIPVLLDSDDPEIVHYGHMLLENNISPHIFRHWYSVKLTLFGEDVASLMYWRGDRSPESALTYLQNKGDLEKEYKKMNNEMLSYHLWASKKYIDNKNGGTLHDGI